MTVILTTSFFIGFNTFLFLVSILVFNSAWGAAIVGGVVAMQICMFIAMLMDKFI